MTYQPMTNDRRDFDPMGDDWSYILDNYPADTWRQLVAVKARRASWPFADRGITGDRWGKAWHSARLAPDWAFYAWGHEYVLVSWDEARPHEVVCRLVIERRYHDPETGHRVEEWTGQVTLDLREQTQTWQLCPRDAERGAPGDVAAEAAHKGAKLLAFFNDACEHWRAGDQARPVQAYDLAHPDN